MMIEASTQDRMRQKEKKIEEFRVATARKATERHQKMKKEAMKEIELKKAQELERRLKAQEYAKS